MFLCAKKRFSENGAAHVVARAILSPYSHRKEIRYYWCYQCKSYHVTSQPYAPKELEKESA